MKYLDEVRVITDREEYANENVYKGMKGTIMFPEIRYRAFYVIFSEVGTGEDIADISIRIEDLELVSESNLTFEEVCENVIKGFAVLVKDGYIIDTEGEKLNKIPYDYNS